VVVLCGVVCLELEESCVVDSFPRDWSSPPNYRYTPNPTAPLAAIYRTMDSSQFPIHSSRLHRILYLDFHVALTMHYPAQPSNS
jgi:hypothetical protein